MICCGHLDALLNFGGLVLGVFGEVLFELGQHNRVPDRARNGRANQRADRVERKEESSRHGNVMAAGHSLHDHLQRALVESSACANEHLSHVEKRLGGHSVARVDKAHQQNVSEVEENNPRGDKQFGAFGVLHDESSHHAENLDTRLFRVVNSAGLSHGHVVGDLKHSLHIRGEGRVFAQVQGNDDAGEQGGFLQQGLVLHKRIPGNLGVPQQEQAENDESNDQKCNQSSLVPFIRTGRSGQCEWNEKQHESDGHQNTSEQVQLDKHVVAGLFQEAAFKQALERFDDLVVTGGLGLAVHDVHHSGQNETGHKHDNGPHTVAPSPGRVLDESVLDDGSDVERRHGSKRIRELRHETTVDERRSIGDEHLLEHPVPDSSNGVQDLCTEISLHVLARGLKDVGLGVHQDRETKTLAAAEKVVELGHYRVRHNCGDFVGNTGGEIREWALKWDVA
ncbi:hypothetical protein KL915_004478 [Ogataea haglerorum]|nr:hypothetical protein KL915_004478 [Ogataea haglerorum]